MSGIIVVDTDGVAHWRALSDDTVRYMIHRKELWGFVGIEDQRWIPACQRNSPSEQWFTCDWQGSTSSSEVQCVQCLYLMHTGGVT